jgi:hypothetical protein
MGGAIMLMMLLLCVKSLILLGKIGHDDVDAAPPGLTRISILA